MKAINPARLVAGFAGLAIAAALAPAAFAQTDTKPTSRAEVKEETRAANKAGKLMPAGEATPAEKPASSAKTRAERKGETMQARKEGKLLTGGEATYKSSMSQRDAAKGSTKTRAERKAETKEAAKEKKLIPAGEAGEPAKK
jgi:hypothetical protein